MGHTQTSIKDAVAVTMTELMGTEKMKPRGVMKLPISLQQKYLTKSPK